MKYKGVQILSLSEKEYMEGPFPAKDGESGFMKFDEMSPTRYAMGYDPGLPPHQRRSHIGFIPLEPENIEEDMTDHDSILDLGDDVFLRTYHEYTVVGKNMNVSLLRFVCERK